MQTQEQADAMAEDQDMQARLGCAMLLVQRSRLRRILPESLSWKTQDRTSQLIIGIFQSVAQQLLEASYICEIT